MISLIPARLARAFAWAVGLWIAGIAIGSVVFAVPQLKAAPAIPHVSANPFITIPIILLWAFLTPILARRLIANTPDPVVAGIRVGLVFVAVNALLDLVVVVGAMHAGLRFYSYLGVWIAYALLVIVPWLTGRARSRAEAAGIVRS